MPNGDAQRQMQLTSRDAINAPRITPNRNSLDDRLPSLGFHINTGGLPYFEVLLTTDRKLFAPTLASSRSESNWYASRQDSGLIRSTGTEDVFLTPTAVLRSFARAQPHPAAIYYTVVAYSGPDGAGPVFAHPPESLPATAPYVRMASDFRGQTLAAVMGIPSDKLRVLNASAPQGSSRSDDVGEGEDGYGLADAASVSGISPMLTARAPKAEHAVNDPFIGDTSDLAYDDNWGGRSYTSSVSNPQTQSYQSEVPADFTYSDGYEDELGAATSFAAGQESDYSAAIAEPTQLEDEEIDDSDDDGYEEIGTEFSGALAQATPAYGDEAESWMSGNPLIRAADAPPTNPPVLAELTASAKRDLLEHIAHFEAGSSNPYAAINEDGEFAGRFPNHEAAGRYHIGLSYGFVQFTQDSGNLGRLLALMRDRNSDAFYRIFGSRADNLIRITNAAGAASKESPGGRSARVQPVEGADLWREPWRSRFIQAGAVPEFQAAQLQLASDLFVDPMMRFAGWLGLNTDRAFTMVVDRAVQMGLGGARRWIIDAVGPVQTVAQRQQALAALGASDLRSFQVATPGLNQDGEWGPMTHAAMVAALRNMGTASPIPIPTRDQMLDAMVRRAAGTSFAHRVTELHNSTEFQDVAYQLN